MPSTVTDIVADIYIQDLTRIEDFLRTGRCKHEYQRGAVVRDGWDDPFLCRDGEFIELSKPVEKPSISYVELPSCVMSVMIAGGRKGFRLCCDARRRRRATSSSGWRNTLLICGDDEFDATIDVKNGTPAPTVSFLCLSRFFGAAAPLKLAAMLHSGRIKVLDFTADETRKTTAADRKNHRGGKPVSPPEPGFTFLDQGDLYLWHRAATVLFRSGRMRILLGQDDGAYFGCELKGTPNTVREAFESLVPEHIRKVKGVKRQGEWFVVPVDQKNVPAITECAAFTDESIDLPVDDKESARHTVCSPDIRIAKDGRVYAAGGSLSHSKENHPEINMSADKWHAFHRNTAVRSFSQEGVD